MAAPLAVATTHITSDCETYRSIVEQYDWDVDIALAIMKAESGCNTNSDNTGLNHDGSNDKGLMQVNSCHFDIISDLDRFDPAKNIQAAYAIYRGAGFKFTPWSAFNNGKYLSFL